MNKTDSLFYEALRSRKSFDEAHLELLAQESKKAKDSFFSRVIREKLVPEEEALKIMAEELKTSFLELEGVSVEKAVIEKVPGKIASYYRFVPLKIENRVISIAVSLPLDLKTEDEIRTQLGYGLEIVFAASCDIAEALKKYYGVAVDTAERSKEALLGSAYPETEANKVDDLEKLAEDASVIKLVNQLILDAFRRRATDIHIEPYRQALNIRYRIDGLLYDVDVSSEVRAFISAIISRIKIMSNLNIVERRIPQDGRAVVKVQEQMLDLRISTMPTPFGESVVIRILPAKMLFSLERLGLSAQDLKVFETLTKKPHGIIFVTGPTGSGKTTTLYACLNRINTKEAKIITIEDPIEYEMQGITQVQVMPEIGFDFSKGLRSMLRHDPDVIMVGEVRDLETAEIAIRVALTGHLVFSTLHTNDAVSGITRLMDIGLEPYLVASSVEAFIAQRLIRVICPDCKYEDTNAPFEIKELIAQELSGITASEIRIYKGKGCAKCNFTGFFGRSAIYEIVTIDEKLKELILRKASAGQIRKAALSKGMRTLRQAGWQKVIEGDTTPEEVMKVASAEEKADLEGSKNIPLAEAVKNPAAERRSYSRLKSGIIVHYKVFKSQEELLKRGIKPEQFSLTKNISAGGVLFDAGEFISLASIIELRLELPDNKNEPVECLARVIRSEEIEENKIYETAVCFLAITSAERARLDRFIEKE